MGNSQSRRPFPAAYEDLVARMLNFQEEELKRQLAAATAEEPDVDDAEDGGIALDDDQSTHAKSMRGA